MYWTEYWHMLSYLEFNRRLNPYWFWWYVNQSGETMTGCHGERVSMPRTTPSQVSEGTFIYSTMLFLTIPPYQSILTAVKYYANMPLPFSSSTGTHHKGLYVKKKRKQGKEGKQPQLYLIIAYSFIPTRWRCLLNYYLLLYREKLVLFTLHTFIFK